LLLLRAVASCCCVGASAAAGCVAPAWSLLLLQRTVRVGCTRADLLLLMGSAAAGADVLHWQCALGRSLL
jgi:hypothetical protein